jgi:hypothetical protein
MGGTHASHVALPVAPAGAGEKAPRFEPSPHPTPEADALAKPRYAVELDLVNDTVTCRLASPEGGRTANRSRYTVSNREPWLTVIESETTLRPAHPSLAIKVEANCLTQSDARTYTHVSDLRISIGDRLHWQKSWSETVPRNGS